ncbi:hypothetical protein ACHAXR_004735 [Thalassiosira sp. AJA248-18]
MSRRDKQADLRRRMAEARSKLIISKSNTHELDEGAAPAAAGKKRPLSLPSTTPAGGGGSGGILRKPKYTPATTAEKRSAPKKEDDDADNDRPNNALGGLMAGYDDSSSDDDEGGINAAPVGAVANQQQSTKPAPSTTVRGKEPGPDSTPNKKQKTAAKRSSQFEERIMIDNDPTVPMPQMPQWGGAMDVKTAESRQGLKSNAQETAPELGQENDKAAAISNEVWDEFNALLDDDEATSMTDTSSSASKPEAKTEPIGTETTGPLDTEATPANDVTKKEKKPKKKKKKKDSIKEMYDNKEAMNNVEQASYEARLGRLMLLKSKKTHHKNNDTAACELPSTEEFYDPGLAFQQADEDDDDDAQQHDSGDEKINENVNSKSDEGGELLSTLSGEQPPSNAHGGVSLAKILRDRRDQARQLSSRGNDANDTEVDTADDAPDGCWF